MKLQQLRYFIAVVETGGITEAAKKLNISQPALSAGLNALEEELGGRLVERQRKRVRMTPLGVRFHQRALIILNECERAKSEFRRGLSQTFIKVGMLSTVPMPFILGVLQRFAEDCPDVSVSLSEGDVETLHSWILRGRIDAAITLSDRTEGGEWIPLYQDPFALVCGAAHPFSQKSSIYLADLDDTPFVVRTHCERAREAHEILNARGIHVRPVLRTDQDQRAMEAVAANLGVTIVPRSLAANTVTVPITDLNLGRSIGVHLASTLAGEVRDSLVTSLQAMARPIHDTEKEARLAS